MIFFFSFLLFTKHKAKGSVSMVSSQLKDHVGLLVTLLAQAKQLKFLIFYLLYCKFKQQRTNTPIFHFKKFTDVSCYIRHLLHECTW